MLSKSILKVIEWVAATHHMNKKSVCQWRPLTNTFYFIWQRRKDSNSSHAGIKIQCLNQLGDSPTMDQIVQRLLYPISKLARNVHLHKAALGSVVYSTTTAVPLADTINMPLPCPSTSKSKSTPTTALAPGFCGALLQLLECYFACLLQLSLIGSRTAADDVANARKEVFEHIGTESPHLLPRRSSG